MNKLYYFVYILTTKNNKLLYIGVTNNLERRIYEHKHKLIGGYTKNYNLNKLIYYEIFEDINAAIDREKQLKRWHREWKLNLIKEKNIEMIDLSNENGQIVDFRMIENIP